MDLMLLVILGCIFGIVLACMAASKRDKAAAAAEEEREEKKEKEKEREERETEERDRGIGLPALIVFIIIGYIIAALLLGGKDMMPGETEETSQTQTESVDWMQP